MTDRRAGFLLLETLVALLIAAIFFSLLAQVLAGAWQADRRPMERLSSLNVARLIAARIRSPHSAFADHGRIGAFTYASAMVPLSIEPRDALLAPAPVRPAAAQAKQGKAGGSAELYRVTIDVRSSLGRRLLFETVKMVRSK